MATCDACGKAENMPYQCRHCGGTFCADHRLPENHGCPGLDQWNDPGGVFDSGFDDSVNRGREAGGGSVLDRLGVDTGPGGWLGYFRGNVTYTFLALMWVTLLLQYVAAYVLVGTPSIAAASRFSPLWNALFVLSPAHPEYVWTWVTAVFAHGGFFHIAVNSIVIYFFGRLVEQYLGSRDFALLFLGSGALAGLAQIGIQIAQNPAVLGAPVPIAGGVLGASGAGLAIMGVLTVLNPGLRVYLYFIIPVPLWLLTVGYTVITVGAIFGGGVGSGGVAQVAHLVGLGIGLAVGQRVKGKVRPPSQLQFGGGPRRGPGGPGGRGPF
ncbi:MAG: rhomboid family intramembrane serine protease [Halorientalis sp.]